MTATAETTTTTTHYVLGDSVAARFLRNRDVVVLDDATVATVVGHGSDDGTHVYYRLTDKYGCDLYERFGRDEFVALVTVL